MSTRQSIVIRSYGNAKTLKVTEEIWDEAMGPKDVRVKVAYSGINFADIQMRLGFYPEAPKKPFVPGYEVSGVVEAVGESVDDVAVGDKVLAGTYFGGYTSRVTLPRHQVFKLPEGKTLEEGAAIPVNFFTAQLAMFEMGRVRAGDKVLIECATGGVGTLAVQMANKVGANVVGLTTTEAKLGYIENLGAKAMLREAFYQDANEKDFDFILNASGGREINVQRDRLQFTGRIVCIGLSSGVKDGTRNPFRMGWAALRMPRVGLIDLMHRNTGVYGLNALKVLQDESWVRRLTHTVETSDLTWLKPHIGQVFAAQDVASAHELIQTKQATGKVLLSWGG